MHLNKRMYVSCSQVNLYPETHCSITNFIMNSQDYLTLLVVLKTNLQ